jgi:hypothetical protein
VQRQHRQATDEAGPSCAPGPSAHDKSITGGQNNHRKHLARERKLGGKQGPQCRWTKVMRLYSGQHGGRFLSAQHTTLRRVPCACAIFFVNTTLAP